MSVRYIQTEPIGLRHSVGLVAGSAAVYFDALSPLAESNRQTILMLHGGLHSGACWLVTPDGRRGWAYDFVQRGHTVIIPDWPGVGRSGAIRYDDQTGAKVCEGIGNLLEHIDGPVVIVTHSMGGALGWRLAAEQREHVCAVVAVAPGPPGNIQPRPVVLGRSEATLEVQTPHRRVRVPASGPVMSDDTFVDDKLIGSGTRFPRQSRDLYAASLLHASSSLIRERMNIDGSQVRVEDPSRLRNLPVMIVTGTDDLEHPYNTDAAIAGWMNSNGARAEFVFLGERGIHGNGHMMMLEENSSELAILICDWIERNVSGDPANRAVENG